MRPTWFYLCSDRCVIVLKVPCSTLKEVKNDVIRHIISIWRTWSNICVVVVQVISTELTEWTELILVTTIAAPRACSEGTAKVLLCHTRMNTRERRWPQRTGRWHRRGKSARGRKLFSEQGWSVELPKRNQEIRRQVRYAREVMPRSCYCSEQDEG